MQSSIAQLSKWSATAPLCACKKEKIAYICLDKNCPAYKTHKLYCQECLMEGVHSHSKHTDASKFASSSETKWTNFKETVEIAINNSLKSYKAIEPLIKYLESEIIKAHVLPQEFRYITSDLEELKNLGTLVK